VLRVDDVGVGGGGVEQVGGLDDGAAGAVAHTGDAAVGAHARAPRPHDVGADGQGVAEVVGPGCGGVAHGVGVLPSNISHTFTIHYSDALRVGAHKFFRYQLIPGLAFTRSVMYSEGIREPVGSRFTGKDT